MLPANSNAHIFGRMIEKTRALKGEKENGIKSKRQRKSKNKGNKNKT